MALLRRTEDVKNVVRKYYKIIRSEENNVEIKFCYNINSFIRSGGLASIALFPFSTIGL